MREEQWTLSCTVHIEVILLDVQQLTTQYVTIKMLADMKSLHTDQKETWFLLTSLVSTVSAGFMKSLTIDEWTWQTIPVIKIDGL